MTFAGADVHRGSLDDLDSLRDGAAVADGVIHLAFNNISEITDFAAAVRQDLRAVETIGAALEGSGKPFVVTFRDAHARDGTPAGPSRYRRGRA